MGLFAHLLRFYGNHGLPWRKAPPLYEGPPTLESGKSLLIGALPTPFRISFDTESPSVGGGALLWGHSERWTGCKGGSGFEVLLNSAKIKLIHANGASGQEQRFSMPWWGGVYTTLLQFYQDRLELDLYVHKEGPAVRLQFITDIPEIISLGLGWPPAPLAGFKGARFTNIAVERL